MKYRMIIREHVYVELFVGVLSLGFPHVPDGVRQL